MKNKTLVVPLMASLAVFATSASAVEGLSANVGATSNYLWRGVTQTDDDAAVQGGIDYTDESGFYAGTWASNVDFGDDTSSEWDLYGGYASSYQGLDYDLGYIYYMYPDGDDLNFGEVTGSLTFDMLTVGVNYVVNSDIETPSGSGLDDDDMTYIYGELAVPLVDDIELAFHVGYSTGDIVEYWYGEDDNYIDYSASLSKNGFALTVSKTDLDADDDVNIAVSYTLDLDM